MIAPYGGRLVDLRLPAPEAAEWRAHAGALPSVRLSERSECDLELLACGAFSPLDRFMGGSDYARVVAEMRLADGELFPIPITLPVREDDPVSLDGEVALRDRKNRVLAILRVDEIYAWDREEAEQRVFATHDTRHPLVAEQHGWGPFFVSGEMRVIDTPIRHDFRDLRLDPRQTRERLAALHGTNVVAFQTRNPLHRGHEELLRRALDRVDGALLLHPVVGISRPGDVDNTTRIRTYEAVVHRHFGQDRAVLALLPLAMRFAGPREALWHAIVRRNYGATHFIVGRDHASPGVDGAGRPFYGTYEAQEVAARHAQEIGVVVLPFRRVVYVPSEDRYADEGTVAPDTRTVALSGALARDAYLARGRRLPSWFVRPEVAAILADAYPPKHRQGVCVWLTGPSGSGKSTIGELLAGLLEEAGRRVTVLDGDVVRTHLSRGLGYSRTDRDVHIRRIGFVASEIVRHGGVVICAAISPYRATRNDVRAMVGTERFIEVFVDAPIAVCEARDTKGLYARARRGELMGFTGIDDPYEPPRQPDVHLRTEVARPEDSAAKLFRHLARQGFVEPRRARSEAQDRPAAGPSGTD